MTFVWLLTFASKAFTKFFEAPQRSVKIKFKLSIFPLIQLSEMHEAGRVKTFSTLLSCANFASDNYNLSKFCELLCRSAQIRISFWSVFSRIRTKYGEILRISPYSVRMREKYGPKITPYSSTFHAVTKK